MQFVAKVPPPGTPAAADKIKSVSGVMLTVCPALVAIELRATCLPLAVPVMESIKGATMPSTFTINEPS